MAEEETKKTEATAEAVEAKEEKKEESKEEHKKSDKVAVPKEFEKLVGELDKMSALDISKFVKFLEEYWGVSAAAPAVAVAAAPAGGDGAPAAEEKSEYDVILKDPGAQ